MQGGFDRPFRTAHDLSHLGDWQVKEIVQLHRHALPARQTSNNSQHVTVPGGLGLVRSGSEHRTKAAPVVAARPVGQDRQQPTPGSTTTWIESLPPPPRPGEALLHNVVAISRADHARRQVRHRRQLRGDPRGEPIAIRATPYPRRRKPPQILHTPTTPREPSEVGSPEKTDKLATRLKVGQHAHADMPEPRPDPRAHRRVQHPLPGLPDLSVPTSAPAPATSTGTNSHCRAGRYPGRLTDPAASQRQGLTLYVRPVSRQTAAVSPVAAALGNETSSSGTRQPYPATLREVMAPPPAAAAELRIALDLCNDRRLCSLA